LTAIEIEAEVREILGKRVNRLRNQGLVPANIYGGGQPSQAVQIPERVVQQEIAKADRSTEFRIAVGGAAPRAARLEGVQRHPTSGQILHLDFQAL
jgi:large subunit ribosomal protein L25